MSRIAVLVASLLALLVPAPVRAAFHIAVIDEVMSGVNNGTVGNSNIQYVEIRQLFSGQNNVCHTRLTVFKCQADGGGFQVLIDNLGGPTATQPCVPNGTAGARWIMASPDGATFLAASGITPDAIWNNAATGRIPTSCGMVCWGAPRASFRPLIEEDLHADDLLAVRSDSSRRWISSSSGRLIGAWTPSFSR
jgi:hypothetical protein